MGGAGFVSSSAGGYVSIIIKGLGKTFQSADRAVEAVRGIDLECEAGSFTSVLGPSGCGKTTLLRMAAGLIEPTEGRASVLGLPADEARKKRLGGMVFQRPVLLPWRTVLENLALPAEISQQREIDGASIPDRAARLVELVGLEGFESACPHELSGGMQSRVGIARALMLRPKVLFLDEPFAALDQITREKMQAELSRICAAEEVTALLVTHSINEAILLGDRVLVMSERPGRIIADERVPFPRPRGFDTTEQREFIQLAHRLRLLL